MKRILPFLAFVVAAWITWDTWGGLPVNRTASQAAAAAVAGGGGGGGGADVTENFEGTGYENSWTEATGAPDEDQDTTGLSLEASQCLYLPNAAGAVQAYTAFTSSSTAYAFCMVRFEDLPSSGDKTVLAFGNGTDHCDLTFSVGPVQARLYSGGEDVNDAGSSSMSADTTYYFWLEYEAGSGANGVFRFYTSTTTTKPGTADAEITTSNDTFSVDRLLVGNNWSGSAGNIYIDKVRVSRTTAFGSNPS